MARKHKPEEIIGKLREAEIVLAQGGTVADALPKGATIAPAPVQAVAVQPVQSTPVTTGEPERGQE